MMKKILSVLLLVAMIFVMASCGGNAKKGIPNFDVPDGGYDGSEVTITFYHTMGSNLSTVLNSYIESFNKLYPNIHIVHTQVGSYDDVRDQISTEITVKNTITPIISSTAASGSNVLVTGPSVCYSFTMDKAGAGAVANAMPPNTNAK